LSYTVNWFVHIVYLQRRAKLGIDSSRDELLGDDTHDSEDQVCNSKIYNFFVA